MAFSPGQFITAQRLNRLQPKAYWSLASGTVTSTVAGTDVPGTAMSITTETDGATAIINWSTSAYAGASAPAANMSSYAIWDTTSSPHFVVFDFRTANEKGTGQQNWVTTIPTAGTYTFKIKVNLVTNWTVQVYTAMSVEILEVV